MARKAQIGDIFQDYARRGVFRAFDRQAEGCGVYRFVWHRDQMFECRWNEGRQSLRIACVLPAVPAASPMYRDFRRWLRARQAVALPAHRRCDSSKVALRPYNCGGNIALTLRVLDADVTYAVHALVALVNEIYQDFLSSGLYLDWQIDTFDLDPDHPW